MLHLVGILFPHINEDARSKSHQICLQLNQCKQQASVSKLHSDTGRVRRQPLEMEARRRSWAVEAYHNIQALVTTIKQQQTS